MTAAAKNLDVDAVRAFVMVAELRSFTRAAEALGTTQSAISLKLKRLERQLGRLLIERTPRLVRLSDEGALFLDRARELIFAHERAIGGVGGSVLRLRLGISEHAAGAELPLLVSRMSTYDPMLRFDVRIGLSANLRDAFDRGECDAVIVRREGGRRGGEPLLQDRFGWFAAADYRQGAGEPVRLATLAPPCGVHATAVRALKSARIPWVEAFVGGGLAAVTAAVTAGLAVAPLAARLAPVGAVDVGPALRLPKLPRSEVVLHSRVSDARLVGAVRTLAAAFRSAARANA